jgi:hypothetical protein
MAITPVAGAPLPEYIVECSYCGELERFNSLREAQDYAKSMWERHYYPGERVTVRPAPLVA